MITETASSPERTTTGNVGAASAQSPCECKPPSQIKNIMVAVDFSDCSKAALDYAVFLAEKFAGALTLVHSVEPYIYPEDLSAGYTVDQIDGRWMDAETSKLENLKKSVKQSIPATSVVTMGTPWNRIVGAAKSHKADIIVIGTHGRTGLKHALMGSTAEKVVRHAQCPVVVVHAPCKAA
jgi:universal stress protein A